MEAAEVEVRRLLSIFFGDNQEYVEEWLNSKNAMFGGIVPAHLIAMGRAETVLKWVQGAMWENGHGQY